MDSEDNESDSKDKSEKKISVPRVSESPQLEDLVDTDKDGDSRPAQKFRRLAFGVYCDERDDDEVVLLKSDDERDDDERDNDESGNERDNDKVVLFESEDDDASDDGDDDASDDDDLSAAEDDKKLSKRARKQTDCYGEWKTEYDEEESESED